MKIPIILTIAVVGLAFLMLFKSGGKTRSKGADWAAQELEKEYGSLGKTIEDLLSLEGSKPTHTILFAIEYKIGRKLDTRGLNSLSDAEGKFYAIEGVEREVNNGGFDQYFLNSAGDHSEAALAGLPDIGAKATATLMERAISVFPANRPPADRAKRQEVQQQIAARAKPVWEQSDSEYYKLTEPIGDLLLAYTKKKKAEFVFP